MVFVRAANASHRLCDTHFVAYSVDYFEWRRSSSSCNCGWSGPNSDLSDFETFNELFEYFCPRCNTKLGLVTYPDHAQIRAAAAEGDDEAIRMAARLP